MPSFVSMVRNRTETSFKVLALGLLIPPGPLDSSSKFRPKASDSTRRGRGQIVSM